MPWAAPWKKAELDTKRSLSAVVGHRRRKKPFSPLHNGGTAGAVTVQGRWPCRVWAL